MTSPRPVRGDVAVLVPAAGLGTRLGPGAPKALRELGGASLLVHAVRRLAAAAGVGLVVVAAPPDRVEEVRAGLEPEINNEVALDVVPGGATRQVSVFAALRAVTTAYPIILVHDAARAFAPVDLVQRVITAVRAGHDAVIPVLPVADTIKRVDPDGFVVETVDRSVLRAVQTPQGFRHDLLRQAHERADQAGLTDVTDDAGLMEWLGVRVFCVAGADEALKVTRPGDLVRAEHLLSADPVQPS